MLVLPVLLAHFWLGETVQQMRLAWSEVAAPMPARIVVAYVREMKAAAPVARAAQPPAKPRQLGAPAKLKAQPEIALAVPPEAAASEAQIALSEMAALAPDLTEEPLAAVAAEPEQAASASASASASAAEPGPEWPLSTLLTYRLSGNYRGEVHGNAQVEWIRQGSNYQMHLDVSVGPSFAPLISRRMSSDGELTPAGIAPRRYDEQTRVMFAQPRRSTLLFHGDSVTLANGRKETVPVGVQDAASQFVHLTWLFLTGREPLKVGAVIDIPLVLPRRQYLWRYEVLEEQELQTPSGPLQTWHLKPTKAAGGGDLSAEVWIAPSLQYLPVRLRIRQDEQTYIDLMLNSPPQQGAP